MATGKSFNLKNQKMTKESIRIFWAHTEARKDFCRHHIEQRSSIVRAKKRIISYSTALYWSGELMRIWRLHKKREIYDHWDVVKNRNLSELWTGFTRFMLLNERLLKGFDKPGWRLMKIQTTSRPDHVWPDTLTRIWESEHAYGKPLINNNKSRSVWSKIQLYWYWRRKTGFCVVLQFGTRINSDEKIWKKKSSSPNFLILRWKLAHAVSSSDVAYLWDKILRVTLQPGEYEILSSVNLGRKKFELQMLICSANLECTHECGGFSPKKLGNRESRMVRTILEICLSETQASGNREVWIKDLSPQAMLIPDAKVEVEKEWKEVIKRHTKQQRGKSTLLHWWTSVNSKVQVHSREVFERTILFPLVRNNFGLDEFVHKDLIVKWFSHGDEKFVIEKLIEPWQKHHYIAKDLMRNINEKGIHTSIID